uniref:Uncharacterized protein n=1 Tax=Anguilla anguilla TaxID=7936 RepID=A0A0E9SI61_ANGAN
MSHLVRLSWNLAEATACPEQEFICLFTASKPADFSSTDLLPQHALLQFPRVLQLCFLFPVADQAPPPQNRLLTS